MIPHTFHSLKDIDTPIKKKMNITQKSKKITHSKILYSKSIY